MTLVAMDFEDVVRKRKMVRRYKQNMPLLEKTITKLIKNAHRAPSAGHTQVQEFIIVKEPAIKKKLRAAAVDQEYVEDAPLLIVVCSNTSRSVGRYGIRGTEFYSITDGAFASLLILLTAVNEGIGACFVGAFDDAKVSKILNIPDQVRPIGIVCVGYPDEEPARIGRIALSHLVYYDKYGNTNRTVDGR